MEQLMWQNGSCTETVYVYRHRIDVLECKVPIDTCMILV